MRLDLAERLRCPAAHPPTPLVIIASEVVERDLVRGSAGCPVCHAEVRVAEGDVWFDAPSGAAPRPAPRADDPAALERLTALLGLAEPGGTVLLTGRFATLALPLAAASDVGVVTLGDSEGSPTPGEGHRGGFAVASVRGALRSVPFSDGTFRAAALDALTPALASDAVRAVAAGGRVLGALAVPRPEGVAELARDATEWVGERAAAAPLVPLRRG